MGELPDFSKSFLHPVFRQLSDGVAFVAPEPWRIVYANPALADGLGRPPEDLQGELLENIFALDVQRELSDALKRAWQGADSEISLTAQWTSGTIQGPVELRLCRLAINEQTLVAMVLPLLGSRTHLSTIAVTRRDPLTGLPDREFLLSRMARLLRGERLADRQFAVLFIDLDNFKQVNDAHGHLMGDCVLCEVARRLAGCVREGDHVVRFGGDEFVVLVERVMGREEIDPIVERIHTALARPIALPEGEFTLTLSIGTAEASADHLSPEDLLREADLAMYAAKRVQG